MSAALDEFEEYKACAFRTPRSYGRVISRDDSTRMADTSPMQARMRMRASFKSESAYRRNHTTKRQQQQEEEHEMMMQRLAHLGLGQRSIGESVVSVFGSDDEIDCDFPSPGDRVQSESDDDIMVPVISSCVSRICSSPVRVAMVDNAPTAVYTAPMSPSPPSHYRSNSCKVRSHRPRDIQFRATGHRRRTYSMPSRSRNNRPKLSAPPCGDESDDITEISPVDEFYRVRTFSTSAKGIVNRGDSFKKKPLSAQSSTDGSVTMRSDHTPRQRALSATSHDSSVGSGDSNPGVATSPFRVLFIGSSGVGKMSIIRQFMSSEYMGNVDASMAGACPSVSVLLDGNESTLEFHSFPDAEEVTAEYAADAYIVMYALNDRESFDEAVECLHELRKKDLLYKTASILVANKGDIVRGREVEEEEGKVMAVRYTCKYIEVSAILNLKVDDLLVGIVKQIRLNDKRLTHMKKHRKTHSMCVSDDNGCIPQPRALVDKFFRKTPNVYRSCDNLLVL